MLNVDVIDDYFLPDQVQEASRAWPDRDWPYWFRYDTELERKQTCADWRNIPTPCQRLLGQMALYHPGDVDDGSIPDLSLYGSGLHSMGRGGHLDVHLDADVHPWLALERRWNAILFLNETWESKWGGQLEFWSPDLLKCLQRVEPVMNRLVVFETTDISYHGIPNRLCCPDDIQRKSLALYWWGWTAPRVPLRPRAQFVQLPAHAYEPRKAALSLQRLQLN